MKIKTLIAKLASLKLTTFCLFFLGVLTFWGTIYQVNNGLYLAQEKFFNSYFVQAGVLFFPSAKLIMWILFLNLVSAFVVRFKVTPNKIGLLVLHGGLITLLISGFVTGFSKEYFLTVKEGEISNLLEDYYKWNLVISSSDGSCPKVTHDLLSLKNQSQIQFECLEKPLKISKVFKNAQLFDTPFAGLILKQMPLEKDYEKNIPGLILELEGQEILLEGSSQQFQSLPASNLNLALVRKSETLPFSIELVDISRELHPGTEIAKSYSSKIKVKSDITRDFEISMNKPFRSGLYTVYQASYGINEDGEEFSVFAVVRNLNYYLPYIGSLLASLGLWINFVGAFFRRRIK